MKRIRQVLGAAVAAMAFSAISANAATVNYSLGDLIVGFTASSGQGSNEVLYVSLGAATGFRDATSNNFSLTNIGIDLTSTFGAGWNERTDLYWGVIGVYNSVPEGGSFAGDPDGTIYASRNRTAVGTIGAANSTAWNTSKTGEDTALAQLGPLQNNFDGQTASVNNASAAVFAENNNTWDKYNPPGANANISFGAFSNTGLGIQQRFGAGSYGSFLGNDVEGALDLYRNLYNTSGAASYEGTFVINANGEIGYVAAVPEPSTYALLALGLGALLFFRRRQQQKA